MKKSTIVPLLFAAALLSAAAVAAVEIPEGVKSNCLQGDFGKNKYATLEEAIVQRWVKNTPGTETPVASVVNDIAKPPNRDAPEKVSIAFMVMDADFEKRFSPVLGGAVRDSGQVIFGWNCLDPEGEPVPDGAYKVVMNIAGEYHGPLLTSAVFDLYLYSEAPVIGDREISSDKGVIEHGRAPSISFSTTAFGQLNVVEYDADGNEVNRFTTLAGPGRHTITSGLTDADGEPYAPGTYFAHVVSGNPSGMSEVAEFEYTLTAPPPLELSVKLDVPPTVEVDMDTEIPYTITLNQNARLKVEHVSDSGDVNPIGKTTVLRPVAPYDKGSHREKWLRVNVHEFLQYTEGSHRIRVTASTLSGEEMTVESSKVTLKEKPQPTPQSRPAPRQAQRPARRTKPKLTLKLEPEHIVIGGRTLLTVRYGVDQDAILTLRIYNPEGKLVRRLIDESDIFHTDKGNYRKRIDAGKFDYGNYKVVLEANNINGESRISEILSVGWQ